MDHQRVIGISYSAEDSVPTVVLKGIGDQVNPILNAARRTGETPIVHNASLANQLYQVPIDAPIGRELFPAMAVLLAQVLDLDQLTATEGRQK
jgi:flagellar biosynthesis protein FlhB